MNEYFGIGSTINLGKILEEIKPKVIFLVTGKKVYQASGASEVLDPILKSYRVIVFNDFEENPKIEEVKRGMEIFKKSKADMVLAVGGGTPMDMAKLINILAAQEKSPESYIRREAMIFGRGKPLVAVPTTSGTGSEATHFAVVYIGKVKYSLAHDYILPDHAIIDPKLTFTLPARITAATGMDALSQGIEAYWSTQSTKESKSYAKEAIKLAIKNLAAAVKNPTQESRVAMSKAAHLAGKAINISKTTAPHAISYPITANFKVPHGHAVGLTLSNILLYNSQVTADDVKDRRGLNYVKKTVNEIIEFLGAKDALDAKLKLDALMKEIGLETHLARLGLKSNEDIELVVKNVNPERAGNNPRLLSENAIEELCKLLF